MIFENIYSIRPFVRYSRYVTTQDFKKFNFKICAVDNRLFYCKRGFGKFNVSGIDYAVSHGFLALIPAGHPYSYAPSETDPMEFVALNFDYNFSHSDLSVPIPPVRSENFNKTNIISPIEFSDCQVFNSPLVLEKMNVVESALERINSEYSKKESLFEIRCSNTLHSVLTRILLRTGEESGNASEDLSERIIEYMRVNYSSEITLETLGNNLGYHPNYLNSVFVRHTGKPIYTYLLDLRISEAINLLQNTGISVAQIASMVGFCDLSHFSKMFKKKTGFSPTDFRIR